MIIESATWLHGPKSEYFTDIYSSDHEGEFVSMEEAHKQLAAKDAEIAKLREENQRFQKDYETLRDLLCHCPECESAPCTMQCRTIRQAKIEVLKEVLRNADELWIPDPVIPDEICKAVDRAGLIEEALHNKLKQLEATK